jgi:hypothetical protein
MAVMIDPDANLSALADVHPIAQRLVAALGVQAVARLTNTDPDQLSDFLAKRCQISGAGASRLIDVEFLLTRVALLFVGKAGVDWLLDDLERIAEVSQA